MYVFNMSFSYAIEENAVYLFGLDDTAHERSAFQVLTGSHAHRVDLEFSIVLLLFVR